MTNRIRAIILTTLILVLSCSVVYAKDYGVNIITQDTLVLFPDGGPFISDAGSTMVPIRFVAQSLGMQVNWSPLTQTVELKQAGTQISFQINGLQALVNGTRQPLTSPAVMDGGRTYVPLRFISEIIGQQVAWIPELRSAFIYGQDDLDYGALARELVKAINQNATSVDIARFVKGDNEQAVITAAQRLNSYIRQRQLHRTSLVSRIGSFTNSNSDPCIDSPASTPVTTEQQKVDQIISRIIKSGMSDYDKVLAVHDYIILNTAYDYDNFLQGTVPATSRRAEGVLFHGKAVCGGYALAFQMFMDTLGIECTIVTGTANGGAHGWNQVKLAGKWYNIDLTWNDPAPDIPGEVQYTYFNLTDEELALTHSWDRRTAHPCTATEYNYYSVNNAFVTSAADFYNEISRQLRNRAATISLKTRGFEIDKQRISDLVFQHANRYVHYLPEKNDLQTYIVTLTSFSYK